MLALTELSVKSIFLTNRTVYELKLCRHIEHLDRFGFIHRQLHLRNNIIMNCSHPLFILVVYCNNKRTHTFFHVFTKFDDVSNI